MGQHGSTWVNMGQHGSTWVNMGHLPSINVLTKMEKNVAEKVLILYLSSRPRMSQLAEISVHISHQNMGFRTCWDMELSSPYRSCPAERLDEAHGSKAQMPWLPIKSRQI